MIRGVDEWQRAGAYSVRIQGMNRQHSISLRDEFDEHDTDGTKYIIILDSGYPIATCRFYETDKNTVTLGRVVVLTEYRGIGLGRKVIAEAEKWIKESGYKFIEIESRTVAVDFYRKLGYSQLDSSIVKSGTFECIRMSKTLAGSDNQE